MNSNKLILFLLPFVVCLVVIFLYGNYRCKNPEYKDILETKIGIGELDGWSLSHLLFNMLIGYLYSDKYLIYAFILGCLWEFFEHYYGEKRPGWLGGYGDCDMSTDKLDGNWWYGKWSDILMNVFGLFLGYYLRKKYQ